jgi:aspartyl aminopeptidase
MSDAKGLIEFIAASPSPFHCVDASAKRLNEVGFSRCNDAEGTLPIEVGSGGYVIHGGTLIAWRAGKSAPANRGFRILGAHTDSPNLRLKPQPEYDKEGYLQWGVEVYGGAIVATWADRDLGLCGQVALRRNGELSQELIRIDRPIARIANLAIHLNREVNDKGLVLNKQDHLPPMIGLGSTGETSQLLQQIGKELDCAPDDVLGWDLCLFDVQAPSLGGLNDEFVFAPRLDNQASCYSALEALCSLTDPPESTAIVVLFDHEECGSRSERGADSTLLRNLLARLERDHPEQAAGGLERAVTNSFQVSADMAHGVHPNFADRHDAQHKPRLNGGPVIKTNVNMRYATNAVTAARFREACQSENVPVQEFVNRSDLACGSTIGPISASALSIPTVDVGNAMLSMHSIREQSGAQDVDRMTRVMARILRDS